MVYKGHNRTYEFRKFKTIRAFGDDIRSNFIICIRQTRNKNNWQIILKNFKVRQNHHIILLKRSKRIHIK